MNHTPKLNRRTFVVGTATAGLSLGFNVPFLTDAVRVVGRLATFDSVPCVVILTARASSYWQSA